jgi:hypothetical protein
MAAILKGTGVVWGMGGVTFAGAGSVIVSATNPSLPQSLRYSPTAQNTKIKSVGGDVVTSVYHGFKKTLSISIVPSADTIAAAVASKEAHLVAPGSKLIVVDASGATVIEQNWIVVTSKENRTVDGVVTVDLELVNGETDLSATVA